MEKPKRSEILYLPIKQQFFDMIVKGTKKEEYRLIKDTTASKYLRKDRYGNFVTSFKNVDGIYDYNDGVFPYQFKPYKYLYLAVGYNSDRDECLVSVTQIRARHHQVFNKHCYWETVFCLGEVVQLKRKGENKAIEFSDSVAMHRQPARSQYKDAELKTPEKAYGINDILKEIRLSTFSEREKGGEFEKLMKAWLLTDPRYNNLTKVWLWEEFPGKSSLGSSDLGIDLVALTETGDYWAIQCKCYDENTTIDKKYVDSFLANASRTFVDDLGQTRSFSDLVWIETLRRPWGQNAQKAIQGLEKPFTKINLFELENSAVDWRKLRDGLFGDAARLSGKQPRKHQLEAISAAYKYFIEEGNERGKLIMACGTGKTYTSLKIMEKMTDKQALVLFLVPSIALLGQTLNAWMSDRSEEMRAVCVCSDAKVTRKAMNEDDTDESITDLAVPATTKVPVILQRLKKYGQEPCRTVIFSTYQSIDVVAEALGQYDRDVDLCICDEAHRTTGIKLKDRDESYFTKIHKNDFIRAKKRLYMTATPRLYRDSTKVKAAENDAVLCSMDDERLYGKEFYRLSFNKAVSQGLLCDYKVLILTVSEDNIPPSMSTRIKEKYVESGTKLKELQFDDATKLIGCINGLSKRIAGDKGVTREQDPAPMKRAVAFCQTINPTERNPKFSSTQIAGYFGDICTEYKENLPEEERQEVVNVESRHIDGSMDAATRNSLISWLKEESSDPMGCKVLCNVRCLSEGVDVPALDAVMFLSPRNSEVEVVQSVGRVMRTFGRNTDHEKRYGYIIIPVIVPSDVSPEEAMNDNERFRVVWEILNALRSHDEEFNAHVNQIQLNKNRDPRILVAPVPKDSYTYDLPAPDNEEAVFVGDEQVAIQTELRFGNLQDGIYAKIVEKVGDRLYWENWAKEIGQIARKFIDRIAALIRDNATARTEFEQFMEGLKKNINPSIDQGQVIEMLAQHLITGPVFDALFSEYKFVQNNAVSRAMHKMIEILKAEGFEMETQVLDRFYTSVRINVGNIDNLEAKQTIIKNLYEKFFKGAFPLTVEKLGIVYTPVECVDYIIRSVNDLLKQEFNTSLSAPDVQVLDPFVGTGTFVTRLLQSGLIKPEDMRRKYLHEIFCNEIVLLAYYIADVNIEAVYHDLMHPDEYENYDGICLTDTFQITENEEGCLDKEWFPENSAGVERLKKAPIKVIMGNPPYSIGQKSANDNAQNQSYEKLDARITETYVAQSVAGLNKSTYDSYIKAFRWSSDKISRNPDGGIVAFISNGAWLDGNAQDGFRKCLEREFSKIYVLNLRGNARTQGESRKREAGNIFGSGSRTPIAITFLVKKPGAQRDGKAEIYYHDIGDYLSREQKLQKVREYRSIGGGGFEWQRLTPNEHGDWISMRNDSFSTLIPLAPEKKFKADTKSTFVVNGPAVATGRDAWDYNFSKSTLNDNMRRMLEFYNKQREEYSKTHDLEVEDFIDTDATKISWTVNLKSYLNKNLQLDLSNEVRETCYRPFTKSQLYFDKYLIERPGLSLSLFPSPETENLVICVSCMGTTKSLSVMISSSISDYHTIGDTQCFPLYWYEERKRERTLFDTADGAAYVRHDGISDWMLREVRSRYGGAKNITKEMIFYYVYGLLHSPQYRETFAADLKMSLPRIPIVERVEDFMAFAKAGRRLAELHLGYETVAPDDETRVNYARELSAGEDEYAYYAVTDKLRFRSKNEKNVILYNGNITIENIPDKAYQYIVNGKSAIEWIVERYCVSVDKKSLIKNDANLWAREHGKPRYILDLLLSVINVSKQTVDIVAELPKLEL